MKSIKQVKEILTIGNDWWVISATEEVNSIFTFNEVKIIGSSHWFSILVISIMRAGFIVSLGTNKAVFFIHLTCPFDMAFDCRTDIDDGYDTTLF